MELSSYIFSNCRPQKLVWHGAEASGSRDLRAYCEAWHSDAVNNQGLASDLLTSQLLAQVKVGCNNKLIVLCVEIASQHQARKRREAKNSDLSFQQYTQLLQDYDGLQK